MALPASGSASSASPPSSGSGEVIKRARILLVEDEPDIVRGLTDVLEFEGYEVITHMQGRAGVREMKERGADLVILDLMLPDINGFQVCEEIRDLPRRLRVHTLENRRLRQGSRRRPETDSK